MAMDLRKRVLLEVGLVLPMLAMGALLGTAASWHSNHIVHVGLEAVAVAGAGILTALGFLSFMDSGRRRSLIQGTTFLAAGLMDLLHVAPFAKEGLSQIPGLAPLTCTGGWYGAKILLGGGMLLALELKDGIVPVERRRRFVAIGSFVAALLALVTALVVVLYFPKDSAALHASPAGGPLEAIPLLLFLSIGIPLVQTKNDTVTQYLGRSMLVAAWSQAFMVFSAHVNDLPFVAAHAVKVVSSGIALAGILVHYGHLFRQTRRTAEIDPLTGLANLRHLVSLEQHGLKNPVLVLADIDHFKQMNDRYGHPAGDIVLTRIGRTLHDILGHHCTLARYGGDEFLALFQGCGKEEVLAAAEVLRRSLAEEAITITIPYKGESVAVRVTVSIGVAASTGERHSLMELLEAADKAAYKAKASGRNRVVAYSDQLLDELLPESAVAPEHMDRLASISQVVGRLAQQITPPLHSVQAELEHIRQGRRIAAGQIEKALVDLRRVDYLLRSMHELSAHDASENEAPDPIALGRLLDPVMTHVNALAAARNAQLNVSLAGLETQIITRTKLLQATVLNLLTNGLNAMVSVEDRQLTLGVSTTTTDVVFEIRDTGPGIPLTTLHQLGEPFVTGHQDAVGMGYYSLQQILQGHGGFAQLFTRRGKGTTIWVQLPLFPKPHKGQLPTRLRAVTRDTFEFTLGEPGGVLSEGLTIGALAAQSGVSESTIRAWERRYGVPRPARLPNGYRVYSHQDLQAVIWLKNQVDAGVRIGEAVQRLAQNPDVVTSHQAITH